MRLAWKGHRYPPELIKTKFRVKHQGWLSHLVNNVLGINQGGVANGLLFRKYIADLGSFLASEYGIYV